jgi:dUTP pyrophosphatase
VEQGVLPKQTIRRLLDANPPLVAGLLNPDLQLQPCGIDLTVAEIASLEGVGKIGIENEDRILPELSGIPFDEHGWMYLDQGSYLLTVNEIISLPADVMALGRPRSSLLRSGVTVGTAVWDPGYQGRSQCLFVVHNNAGFRLERNARIMQVVFFHLDSRSETAYQGIYQNENL